MPVQRAPNGNRKCTECVCVCPIQLARFPGSDEHKCLVRLTSPSVIVFDQFGRLPVGIQGGRRCVWGGRIVGFIAINQLEHVRVVFGDNSWT